MSGTGKTNRGSRWFNLVALEEYPKAWKSGEQSPDLETIWWGEFSLGETDCLLKHSIALEYAWLECEYFNDDTSKGAPILACTEMESGSLLVFWGKPLLMNCLTLPSCKSCKCESENVGVLEKLLVTPNSWREGLGKQSQRPWTSRPRGSKWAPQPEWLASENRWKSGDGITRGIPVK